MVEKNVKDRRAFVLMTYATLFFGLMILAIQFANGEFFNGRRFYLASADFRPLFNATISLFPIAFIFISLRFRAIQREKRS